MKNIVIIFSFLVFSISCKSPGITELLSAIEMGDVSLVQEYIDYGVPIEDPKLSEQPIVYAVKQGNVKVIKILLNSGADPDSLFTDGFSLVKYSVLKDKPQIVKLLVNYGCDIIQPINYNNDSLLIWAIKSKQDYELIEDILDKDPDLTHLNNDGFSAIDYSFMENNLEVIKYLIKGNYIDDYTLEGMSPLEYSFSNGNLEQIKLILGNVNQEKFNDNAFQESLWKWLFAGRFSQSDEKKIIDYLIEQGIDPELSPKSFLDVLYSNSFYTIREELSNELRIFDSSFSSFQILNPGTQIVFIEKSKDDDYIYKVISEDLDEGWINLKETDLGDEWTSLFSVEYKRNGPLQYYKYNNMNILLIDNIRTKGPVHLFERLYNDRFLIFKQKYWEGRSTLIIDSISGNRVTVLDFPVFSDKYKSAFSISTFYAGRYTIEIFNYNDTDILDYEKIDLPFDSEYYHIKKKRWEIETGDIVITVSNDYFQNDFDITVRKRGEDWEVIYPDQIYDNSIVFLTKSKDHLFLIPSKDINFYPNGIWQFKLEDANDFIVKEIKWLNAESFKLYLKDNNNEYVLDFIYDKFWKYEGDYNFVKKIKARN